MKKDKKIILQSIRNTLQQIAPAGNRLLPQTKIPCDVKRSRGYDKTAHWNLAVQRLYYASFYMASALLLKNNIAAQSHNGVVSQSVRLPFCHYRKTGQNGRQIVLTFTAKQNNRRL